MSDNFTSILACRLQETGGNSDTWGTKLNDEAIQYLEDKICDITTINTTGGNTTITDTQGRCNIIKVTGTLVSNAVIIVPNEAHSWYVWNATTDGGFSTTVKTSGGSGSGIANIPPGCTRKVFCDAADGVFRTDFELIGTTLHVPYGMTIPDGVFEVPAGGSPDVSRTGIYRDLFRLFGTTYGAGDGANTFALPFVFSQGDGLAWNNTTNGTVCIRL